MTTLRLTDDALELFQLTHRAGEAAYLWGHSGDPQSKGTTRWFKPGDRPKGFNSDHNNYFGVNTTTAPGTSYQRAKKGERDIAAVSALFTEIDDKDHGDARGAARAFLEARIAGGGVPRPTAVIDSGGGVQAYWGLNQPYILDTPEKREHADRTQKAWVNYVGGDDGAKDLARVLRVPGTLNFKYDPPRPVMVIEADYSRLYTLDELAALLPPQPTVTPKPERERRPTAINIDFAASTADFDAIAAAAQCLKRLSPDRRDSYTGFYQVGMALKELGAIGYNLWELWSQPSPKYQVGACAEKWKTFKPGPECDGVTLASLQRWADEDDPEGAPAVPEEVQQQLAEYKREEVERVRILKNPDLEDREKVAWLAIRNTLDIRLALRRDGSVRLSGEDVGHVMGRSASTGNRATRMLEEHGVLVCDPEPFTLANGKEAQQMRVLPGPAFDNAELVQPAASKKKRGGARPGAGRKPACPDCPPGTIHRKITMRSVSYHCAKHGLIAEEVLPNVIEDYVPDTEINIDYAPEELGEMPAGDAPDPEPEINFASRLTTGYLSCNSAHATTDSPDYGQQGHPADPAPPTPWGVPPDDPWWEYHRFDEARRAQAQGAKAVSP